MSETVRQCVHIGSVVFALLLRWLTPTQAIALGCGAVAFNVWILPIVGRGIFRAHETPGRLSGGIVIYPLAVLALMVVCGAVLGRMDVAAGAWAVMAVGDGMSTLTGRALRGPRIPWNRSKTWAGSGALAICGAAACAFLLHWVGGWERSSVPLAAAAVCAGVAAAWIESLPLPVDDNVSVPLVSALVLLACAVASPEAAIKRLDARDFVVGAACAAALGVTAFVARSVSAGGLAGGVVLGALMWGVSGGWAFAVLATFFVLGTLATRLGRRAKARAGLAEARGGRRGAAHAWANGLVPLCFATLSVATTGTLHVACAVAAAAGLATAAADTVATEIGQWRGGATFSARTFRRVPPGTPGGVGAAGTAAGLCAAFLVALVCVWTRAVPPMAAGVITCAAGIGSLLESVLHARMDVTRRTPLAHHALNAANTLAGALVPFFLARLVWRT